MSAMLKTSASRRNWPRSKESRRERNANQNTARDESIFADSRVKHSAGSDDFDFIAHLEIGRRCADAVLARRIKSVHTPHRDECGSGGQHSRARLQKTRRLGDRLRRTRFGRHACIQRELIAGSKLDSAALIHPSFFGGPGRSGSQATGCRTGCRPGRRGARSRSKVPVASENA